MNFTVIGAGAWGTAFASHLARRGQSVTLVARRPEHASAVHAVRENRDYLPGVRLPESLVVTSDLKAALATADAVLLAVPSQTLRAWCAKIAEALEGARRRPLFISLTKGLEADTHLRPSEVMAQVLPGYKIGTLTGPTNAGEVARGLPAAMVLATEAPDDPLIAQTQVAISGSTLRLYTSNDLLGAEYGGCLKNIYAIAAGCADGLKLGDNAKAALITRALAEMVRVGQALGAKAETFYGLSGFGDLVATCHGGWSRNREFGQRLGEGHPAAELMAGRKTVVEGYRTAEAFHGLVTEKEIVAPILTEVYAVLYQRKKPADALLALMTRELKRETQTVGAK